MFSFLTFLPSRRQAKRQEIILAFRRQCRAEMEAARVHGNQVSEDSYATRAEYREDEAEAREMNNRLEAALADGCKSVDLRETCTIFPEDEALSRYEAESCGLEYVSYDDKAEALYHRRMNRYAAHIAAMKKSGIEVQTGFSREEYEE